MTERLRTTLHYLTVPALLAGVWVGAHVRSRSVDRIETTWREGSFTRRGNPFTAPVYRPILPEPVVAANAPTTMPAEPGGLAAVPAD